MGPFSANDERHMRAALALARSGLGKTSPNPMVGAVVVRGDKVLGRGWHKGAGLAHAEVEAIASAKKKGASLPGATLYVTLEPCSTHGRTPPCTEAILAAGFREIIVATIDPNPLHSGRGLETLRNAGLIVKSGLLEEESRKLNRAFNHWIVERKPWVTLKAAMTLDGKIATARGLSKWISGPASRAYAMQLRQRADAVLVGVNTIIHDDPKLTLRPTPTGWGKVLRRIVLDPRGRIPLSASVLHDSRREQTTVVVTDLAPGITRRIQETGAELLEAPRRGSSIDLEWLMKKLGERNITDLLVEGGGETNARFLQHGLAHEVAFFYAPKILCGATARKSVAGAGIAEIRSALRLREVDWRSVGADLLLTGFLCR